MLRCAQSPRSNVLVKSPSLVDLSRVLPLNLFEQAAIRVFGRQQVSSRITRERFKWEVT